MADILTPNPSPPIDPQSAILVKLGVLEEGQRNTLAGIGEIKETLSNHSDRIGVVETKTAILETKVDNIASAQKETEENSRPLKGRWSNWVSAVAALGAFVLVLLNQLYLQTH
jgi:hypothetical protein